MKAHAHRLLTNLPDLCASPLTREVRALFDGQLTDHIEEVVIGVSSVFLRCAIIGSSSSRWTAFDRDTLESVTVILNDEACERLGLQPRLDVLLTHLETRRKADRL